MIGHIAAKYDVMMSADDPNFIIVEMNQMALDAASRTMEARILNAVDGRLNNFKPAAIPAGKSATTLKNEGVAVCLIFGVAITVVAVLAAIAGATWYAKYGGVPTVTEQFGSMNNVANMIQCKPLGGQVQTYKGVDGEWCVLQARNQQNQVTSVPAWRVR